MKIVLVLASILFGLMSEAQPRQKKSKASVRPRVTAPVNKAKAFKAQAIKPQASATLDGGDGGSSAAPGLNAPVANSPVPSVPPAQAPVANPTPAVNPAPVASPQPVAVPVTTVPVVTPSLNGAPSVILPPTGPLGSTPAPAVPPNLSVLPGNPATPAPGYTLLGPNQQQFPVPPGMMLAPGYAMTANGPVPISSLPWYLQHKARAQQDARLRAMYPPQNSGRGGGGGGMPSGLEQMLSGLGGGGGGGGQPGGGFGPNNSFGGNNYSPQSSGGSSYLEGGLPYGGNVGRVVSKQGMCTQAGTTQTTSQDGRMPWCDVIYRELTGPTCNKALLDQIAERASRQPISNMGSFCSSYSLINGDPEKRARFFQNLIAALVQEESSWNPRVPDGDNGNSKGLMQINPNDEAYGCGCTGIRQKVYDPEANLRCGTTIVLKNLMKDWEMGRGNATQGTAKGIARYFGPFNDSQKDKRGLIAGKTSNWCSSSTGSPRLPASADSDTTN